jgi:ArsR family transcriptional regulator
MARPSKIDQVYGGGSAAVGSLPGCDEQIVHVDAVRAARDHLPDPARIAAMSALFSALGDPTRLRVVAALAVQELCVCDLAATLGMSQSSVSHQLRVLRGLGLVRPRRDGRRVYYALDDAHVVGLVDQALTHVDHLELGGAA